MSNKTCLEAAGSSLDRVLTRINISYSNEMFLKGRGCFFRMGNTDYCIELACILVIADFSRSRIPYTCVGLRDLNPCLGMCH